jgi:hypothetical protein
MTHQGHSHTTLRCGFTQSGGHNSANRPIRPTAIRYSTDTSANARYCAGTVRPGGAGPRRPRARSGRPPGRTASRRCRGAGGDGPRRGGSHAWTSAGFWPVQPGAYRGTWTFRLRGRVVQDKSRAHIDLTTAHKVPADITPRSVVPRYRAYRSTFLHAPGYKVFVKP